jgi:hypothetical protein
MFRSGQNLKHLHHAREAIKGKVYAGVLGTGSTRDTGVNAAVLGQGEINDEILMKKKKCECVRLCALCLCLVEERTGVCDYCVCPLLY